MSVLPNHIRPNFATQPSTVIIAITDRMIHSTVSISETTTTTTTTTTTSTTTEVVAVDAAPIQVDHLGAPVVVAAHLLQVEHSGGHAVVVPPMPEAVEDTAEVKAEAVEAVVAMAHLTK